MTINHLCVDDVEIGYTDEGMGPPIVFVHGVYVTGAVWSDVASLLAHEHRCIVPTWPLGAHEVPTSSQANLGVLAAGRRIGKFLDALDLSNVTLVANDTGGGIVQAALANPDNYLRRVGRLVFTNCDSFEYFPPAGFAPLVKLCRLNAPLGAGALRLLASQPGIDYFTSAVTRRGIERTRRAAIFGGFVASSAVRRDAVRLTADLHPRYTMAAIGAMNEYQRPVLVAWGDADKVFPVAHARRLADAFPQARLRLIGGAGAYVMLDEPIETANAIAQFIADTA
jgi:pimeloyl-ACP methyl ester carboxylesterase